MTTIITVLLILVTVIVVLIYPLLVVSDRTGEKAVVMCNMDLLKLYTSDISHSIDNIQLLLSDCPKNLDYIIDIHDDTVLINNKYVYNSIFDLSLLKQLSKAWESSREKAKVQLVNFIDIDKEFNHLNKIIIAISKD